ncbi:NUDIX hydrolase [Bacillus pseudomycoides]|uniref:NUDIX hydrolase n=1 Tax=Bacillus pseudomycoides TaxID=64104 RepID=UPI000BEC2BAA|nr:NUDIX domain-containing protein [Bacillus pseudomycoides]PEE40573.1 DNA mismatch repair protein MutT [Bacillus pseudomycoides]PGA90804.1 DNA mismatch repair protein MutT [Bacillus pseudomycoides]PHF50738.1 DNA mismatch repair protein MutT [Bacillus pseudomycoides]
MNHLLQVRVTGILIEKENLLIVKQKVSDRNWSLPGGRVEGGEMREETGLETRIKKLLYICDKPDVTPSLVHITFLLERVSGEIKLPSNEFDHNPIHDVKMVPLTELRNYHFSEAFIELIEKGFPNAGTYQGLKQNIGL